MDIEKIKKQAWKEYEYEMFRDAVEKYKSRIKTKRSLWDKIFPYKILIVKKEELQ